MARLMRLWILGGTLLAAAPPCPFWQPQLSPTQASLRGVAAVSLRVAWASGAHGTVVRTVDGGRHWRRLPAPGDSALDFRSIVAFSPRRAVLASNGPGPLSRIYTTRNAGRSWRLRFQGHDPAVFLDALVFSNARLGMAIGDPIRGRFLLLRTRDGGAHWATLPHAPRALPGEGAFAASNSCLQLRGNHEIWFTSGGSVARVFHSTDAGRTWSVATVPLRQGLPSAGAFSLALLGTRQAVVVGGDYQQPGAPSGSAAFSNDRGRHWFPATHPPQGYRSAVLALPCHGHFRLVTVGTAGSDVSDDRGRSWTPFGAGGYNSLARTGPAGWAVGSEGRIARVALCGTSPPLRP